MNKNISKNVEIELKLLNEIEKKKNHSQRSISKELNIALGLANNLIKKFVSKGFLKLSQAPMKRYFYYITPKGLVEKAKLTSEFLRSSFEFYNKIRNEYEKEFLKIKKSKPESVILIGVSEFTEIAILAAKICDIKIDSIIEKNYKKKSFCEIDVNTTVSKQYFDSKNTFFIVSSRNGVDEFLIRLKKKKIIKPKFLLLD
tara:strand:+ start:1166 stop:1765 length:600 start_codon:yes stop_codon:yes gene_type:complete